MLVCGHRFSSSVCVCVIVYVCECVFTLCSVGSIEVDVELLVLPGQSLPLTFKPL